MSPPEKPPVEIDVDSIDLIDLNRVIKRNHGLERWTRQNLFKTSIIFVASILIGVGFLYIKYTDEKDKDPDIQFKNSQLGKKAHSELGKRLGALQDNTLGILLSSITGILSGGTLLSGVKSYFFPSANSKDLDESFVENDNKLVTNIKNRNKKLQFLRDIYCVISILGSFILIILVIITLKKLLYPDDSNKPIECQDFTECWNTLKNKNFTLNVDTVICQNFIYKVDTTLLNDKLSYCQQEIMGCEAPGILYVFDIYNKADPDLVYNRENDTYSFLYSGIYENFPYYENNTFDKKSEDYKYVYTFTSSYVQTYFTDCFDESFISLAVSIIITVIGICGMIHCMCTYYSLSRPGDLEFKNTAGAIKKKLSFLWFPILYINLFIVGLIPIHPKKDEGTLKKYYKISFSIPVSRTVLAGDELDVCKNYMKEVKGKDYSLKEFFDNFIISEKGDKHGKKNETAVEIK